MGYTIAPATVRLVKVIDGDLAELAKPLELASLEVDPCGRPSERYTLTSLDGRIWTEPHWRVVVAIDMPQHAILHEPSLDAHVTLESATHQRRLMDAKRAADEACRLASL